MMEESAKPNEGMKSAVVNPKIRRRYVVDKHLCDQKMWITSDIAEMKEVDPEFLVLLYPPPSSKKFLG